MIELDTKVKLLESAGYDDDEIRVVTFVRDDGCFTIDSYIGFFELCEVEIVSIPNDNF